MSFDDNFRRPDFSQSLIEVKCKEFYYCLYYYPLESSISSCLITTDPPLFIELFVFLSAGQQLATRPGDARETAMVQSEFSLGRSL